MPVTYLHQSTSRIYIYTEYGFKLC